jgi:hypothetical protein
VEQVLKGVVKGDYALPIKGENPAKLNELIPKASEIAKPDYVPSLQAEAKPKVEIPNLGNKSVEQMVAEDKIKPLNTLTTPKTAVPNTSEIDKEMESISQQLKQSNNQPKPKTKTEIDDSLRSLDINDGYLQSSWNKRKISNEEYRRRLLENEQKRESLLKENQAYSSSTPDELKHIWNNQTRAYEVGDYQAKQAYGGGYSVKKGGQAVGKFRTQEEAIQFMQESVAKEKGLDVSFDKEGVLRWKSSYDEPNQRWEITSGDYSIDRVSSNKWIVRKGNETLGSYRTEAKAREMAQRHFDSQPKTNDQTVALEQRLNELKQQREATINTPKQEPINNQQRTETNGNVNTQDPQVNVQEPPVQTSEHVPKVNGERSFYSTVQNPDKLSPELEQMLKEFDKTYQPMNNKELVQYANEYINQDIDKAYQFVKNAQKFDQRHIVVGHRLIDELQARGEYAKALDVVERLAEQGTKAGQSIQSYSIYNRLSAEGQLIRAQRRVNQINQSIVDPAKQVKLTEDSINNITQAADSIQRLTGQEEQTNNVIKIMDSIKKGNRPTDEEMKTVRDFVSDAKKFIGDTTPNAKPPKPKKIVDIRTRDKVVDFMSKQEDAAKERLKQRMNRANSLPVDMFYDLTVIGASKVAKGVVKFADFSEAMIKDVGEEIRPYMQQIYDKAVETFNLQSESMTRRKLTEVEKITNKALKDKGLSEEEAQIIKDFAQKVGTLTGVAKSLFICSTR